LECAALIWRKMSGNTRSPATRNSGSGPAELIRQEFDRLPRRRESCIVRLPDADA
jgi:hypothetical protein